MMNEYVKLTYPEVSDEQIEEYERLIKDYKESKNG